MKRTTRLLSAALAVLTACSIVSGCSQTSPAQTSSGGTSAPSGSGEETQEGGMEETLEITWLGLNPNNVTVSEGSPNQQYIEEKYNVKLNLAVVDPFNDEALSL